MEHEPFKKHSPEVLQKLLLEGRGRGFRALHWLFKRLFKVKPFKKH